MAGACPRIIFTHASGQHGHEGASADTGQLNQLGFSLARLKIAATADTAADGAMAIAIRHQAGRLWRRPYPNTTASITAAKWQADATSTNPCQIALW